MAFLKRFLRSLPLLVLSPLLMAISVVALAVTDLLWKLTSSAGGLAAGDLTGDRTGDKTAGATCASVVIPNWNWKDLLEKYLP
ncbi:MAG TPA: hypothetical protein VGZ73_03560, partial [Bryobacteraceae bacterium]|nr:hypothetical protein [Bryobacteraceae bacterium]